jgi:signal transduction histidine kinase
MLASCGAAPKNLGPNAENGTIDFSDWDFKANGPAELKGDWKFVPGEFLDFETVEANWDRYQDRVHVPGDWVIVNENRDSTANYSPTGFGTYFLRLKLSERSLRANSPVTLLAEDICCASTIEVWDENKRTRLATGGAGKPGVNAAQERARMNLGAASSWDHVQTTSLLVIIHLSNHVHARPGMRDSPILGVTNSKHGPLFKPLLLGSGVSGILIIIALYHLVLFLQRRDDKLSLTFALLCFPMAVREILTSGIFEMLWNEPDSSAFVYSAALEYITMPLITIAASVYFCALYPSRNLIWFIRLWGYGYGGALILFTLLQTSLVYTGAVLFYHIHLVVSMVILILVPFQAAFQKKDLANWVLLSTLLCVLGFTNDLLYSRNVIQTDFIGPYVFLLFILIQSAIIAKNFSRAMDERDASNSALLETYRQLDKELLKREKLIESNNNLQTEIDAAGQQLIQADKLSSLGQLVAGVAHEIAGPTNYIGLAIQLVQRRVESVQALLNKILDPSDSDAKKVLDVFTADLDEANSEIERIGSGVVKIQDIHSALRNHGRIDPTPRYDLLIKPILNETMIILGSKTKLIDTQVETSNAPLFTGRRSQMSQVLTNLIGNAADAVEEKRLKEKELNNPFEPKILIQAQAATRDDQEMLEVSIHDNGYGIPVEIREKILQPFFTTKEVGKGTGLGMPIIIRIIESHGGSLEITDSPILGGACLKFWIPCNPATDPGSTTAT